jgi:hypothetical protein
MDSEVQKRGFESIKDREIVALKRGTVMLMISILEGAQDEEIFSKVVNSLDFVLLRNRLV